MIHHGNFYDSRRRRNSARGQVQQECGTPRSRLRQDSRGGLWRGQDAVAVTVDPSVITKILHSDSGHNTIFDLDVTGASLVKAMIVDWQNEPIKGALLHIDLKRIAMDKTMRSRCRSS